MQKAACLFIASFFFCSFAPIDHSYITPIQSMGHFLAERGMCPATSGNISVRTDRGLFAVTVSGTDKGNLRDEDVILVDSEAKPLLSSRKPSAEVAIHLAIYDVLPDVSAVVHHHDLTAVVLSDLMGTATEITTQGYEIHKAFTGITTHESSVVIPIFENSQDIPLMAEQVKGYLSSHKNIYGFIIRGHGFYTWGKDMAECTKRVEAFSYLFECEYRKKLLVR